MTKNTAEFKDTNRIQKDFLYGVNWCYCKRPWFFKQILKWLTSLSVDGWSPERGPLWHWAQVSTREPGGPVESDPWDWTIVGDKSLTREPGLCGELETWQLKEEGGAGDWGEPGDRLWGGDGSLCGVREWVLGEWCSLVDEEADASRRLRANRALLTLAELVWIESLGVSGKDWLRSGSIAWPPGWSSSLSVELSPTLEQWLSSQLPSLSFGLPSSSPLFPKSEYWCFFSWTGWTDWSSQTPRLEKKSLFSTLVITSQ